MIQSSLPVWSAIESSNLSESSLADWLCERSRSEPERSEGERSEAEDRSAPSQTGFRQTKQRDQTGGLIESHKLKVLPPPPWFTLLLTHETLLKSSPAQFSHVDRSSAFCTYAKL